MKEVIYNIVEIICACGGIAVLIFFFVPKLRELNSFETDSHDVADSVKLVLFQTERRLLQLTTISYLLLTLGLVGIAIWLQFF